MPSKISAEVSCTGDVWSQSGGGTESVEVALKWSVGIDRDDELKLKSGQDISKKIDVSITRNDNKQNLWPIMKGEANENLKVWVLPGEQGLKIDLNILVHPRNKGRAVAYRTREDRKELVCGKDELGINRSGRGESIYSRGNRWGGRGFIANNSKKLNVGVSLNQCLRKSEKQIECSLKVVINNP